MNFIQVPIELLEFIAPEEPMNQDEQGGCVWCGWSERTMFFNLGHKTSRGSMYADSRKETHAPDCPWVAARKLIEYFYKIA